MSRSDEFGKDLGLVQQSILEVRKHGGGREFWKRLAEEKGVNKKVVEFVAALPIFSVNVISEESMGDLMRNPRHGKFLSNLIGKGIDIDEYELEERTSDSVPISYFTVPYQKRESQVRRHMKIWGLRPVNTRELLSFIIKVNEIVNGHKTKDKLRIDRNIRTQLIALEAGNSQQKGNVLGLVVDKDESRSLRLRVFNPSEDDQIWRISQEPAKFLAVPEHA